MIKGSCACGLCSYEAEGELFDVLHCHCTCCRKLSSSAFSTYGAVSPSGFSWLCDQGNLIEYQSSKSVSRFFCNTCGSLLTSIDKNVQNAIYLSVGLLDNDTEVSVEYHQFVSSKASWYEITDGLPQYELSP